MGREVDTGVFADVFEQPDQYAGGDFSFSTNYYDYTVVNNTTGAVKGYNYDVGTKLAISGVTAAYDDGTHTPAKTIDGDDSSYWINNNTKASGVIHVRSWFRAYSQGSQTAARR